MLARGYGKFEHAAKGPLYPGAIGVIIENKDYRVRAAKWSTGAYFSEVSGNYYHEELCLPHETDSMAHRDSHLTNKIGEKILL